MPAAAHTGAINWGLVYIPVKLHTAVSEEKVSLNQLSKDGHARIRYKKVREDTGAEVKSDEIVRGYQYEKDKYVVFTDDELEQMTPQKDRNLTITQFVQRGSVNPLFYDKAYYAVPNGSNKPFMLLREALERLGVVAVATTVIGQTEQTLVLSPIENGMVAQTLFYLNEVKAIPTTLSTAMVEISDDELNMAMALMRDKVSEFKPEAYHDATAERMREAVQAKIAGQEFVAPAEVQNNIIDMMDAMKQMLAREQGQQVSQKTAIGMMH